MKRIFSWLAALFATFLLIWVNLPATVPIQFTVGPITVDQEINRPVLRIPFSDGDFVRDFSLKLGLDLQGGTRLVFEADTTDVADEDIDAALASARDIVERRVNLFGIAEPSVQTVRTGDTQRIAVELPGVTSAADAVDLIGSTAQLSFRELSTEPSTDPEELTEDPIATTSAATSSAEPSSLFSADTEISGDQVERALATLSPETGEPIVELRFTDEGSEQFADLTSRNVGQPIAILLDDTVISAPIVQQPILGGTASITGQASIEEAQQLAIAINSGALPVPLELIEQTNVGPSLGEREVMLSLIAGIVGLSMVMVFMIWYYGRMGVIACAALLLYGLITLAIFRLIPIVLTLPGIAGFILSIGMAVDANILIFERIREERRKGHDEMKAIRLGFGRAMDAIKDANSTTLVVAFILFNPLNWSFLPQFGLVRGFALTLAIGVIISLFTGVFITQRLITTFLPRTR